MEESFGACQQSLPDPLHKRKLQEHASAQSHAFSDPKRFELRVLGVPEEGTRSRVETQIRLCLQLQAQKDRPQQWSQLRLPEHLIVRDRPRLFMRPPSSPRSTLFLEASVLCASDLSKQAYACFGCIERERKRCRKKREQAQRSQGDSDGARLVPEVGAEAAPSDIFQDQQKILLFNCPDTVDFFSGNAILPTRLTCYCRHHNEKAGFCVYFSLRDHLGEVVASALSPPIMITDDHKSLRLRGTKRQRTADDPVPLEMPFLAPLAATAHPLPLPAAPKGFFEPPAPAAPSPSYLTRAEQLPKEELCEISEVLLDLSDEFEGQREGDDPLPEISRVVPTEGPLQGGIEVTVLGTNFYNGIRVMFGDNEAFSCHFWSPTTLICILPPSTFSGLVPVTIKPRSLAPSHLLDSRFSPPDEALSSSFSSPPSVPLVDGELRHDSDPLDFANSILDTDTVMFNYRRDADRELMELALKVIGMKLTGKAQDASQIAAAILRQVGHPPGGSQTTQGPAPRQNASNYTQEAVTSSLETCLAMQTFFEPALSLRNGSQQTMLHLAAVLGWADLCSLLIRHDIDLNATDRNEFTALHFASWMGHQEVANLLVAAGADVKVKNAYGLTPENLAHPKLSFPLAQMGTPQGSAPQQAAPSSLAFGLPSIPLPTFAAHSRIPGLSAAQGFFNQPTHPSPPSQPHPAPAGPHLEPGPGKIAVSKVEKLRRRKRDRMTYNFWIPLFLAFFALALFQIYATEPARLLAFF